MINVDKWTSTPNEKRVRQPLRTQSCNVWINQSQLQSQMSSASILPLYFVFMMASEEKPFSHWFVVAKGRRKQSIQLCPQVQGIRFSAVSISPTMTAFWKQTSMFRRMTILLDSPAHQHWSPLAFQRFWCWTGFSSSGSLQPSLQNIGGTVLQARCGVQWCCSWLLNRWLWLLQSDTFS